MNRRNSMRGAAVITTAAAVAIALIGCTAGEADGDGDGEAKSLVLASPTDHTGFDPAAAIGVGPTNWLDQGFYDRLFDCNADGSVIPNVAESWELSDDRLSITVDIRDGMTFTDGAPVDAEAVKASIDYLKAESNGAALLADVEIEVADDLTAVVRLTTPNPEIFTVLCGAQGIIASPEYLASSDRDSAPLGSGPYTYDAEASSPGASYVMKKNPDNWNADAYPYETVTVQVIEDTTASLNALKSGQVAGAAITNDTVNEARSAGIDLVEFNSTWAGLILSDRAGSVVPALGDPEVRRAINMAFDKQAYAESLFGGAAVPTSQIFREGSPAFIADIEDPYPYDPAKAREMLADAGYPDGFDVKIPFLAGFGWDSQMPVVIDQLAQIGIRVEPVTLSGPNAIGDMLSGTYGMIYWPLGNSGNSLTDIRQVIAPSAVWNTQRYEDPTVNDLISKIWESTDEAESKALLVDLNEYLIEQAWFAPIVAPTQYFGYDADVVSIPESTDFAGLTPNLRDFK